jgi:hypothetical protein
MIDAEASHTTSWEVVFFLTMGTTKKVHSQRLFTNAM